MQRNGLESGVPANFKGKKGRSGRYSVADEALKNRVKHKAWSKTEAEMDKNGAIQIVLKDMTVKADIMSGGKRIGGIDLEEFIKYANKTNQSVPENKVDDEKGENLPGGDVGLEDL